MKNILILNGSPRKNGKTNELVKSFKNGAQINNDVKEFHLYDMNLNGCLGCNIVEKIILVYKKMICI